MGARGGSRWGGGVADVLEWEKRGFVMVPVYGPPDYTYGPGGDVSGTAYSSGTTKTVVGTTVPATTTLVFAFPLHPPIVSYDLVFISHPPLP